jgi:copper chaperone CopZ
VIERTYTVVGMACSHCEGFVTEELERVEGVIAVAVDVDRDRVTVTSEREPEVTEIRAAVEAAGYELATPHP